jgi:hypothetical protein
MSETAGGHDFEDWLSRELGRALDTVQGSRPRAAQAAYRAAAAQGGRFMAIKAALVAGVTSKAAAGAAAVALAAAGGAVAASAATGSPNPAVWGRTVVQAVEHCKQERTSTSRGIGGCVSAVARTHGISQRERHVPAGNVPSPTPTGHGAGSQRQAGGSGSNGSTHRQDHGQSSGQTNAQDHGQGHGYGRPSPTPTP